MNLSQRDKQVIWHPFTPQKSIPEPIAIVNGEGVYLIDEFGNKYIDAISSWWVNLHGHAHPYIAEKIFEQAKKLEQVIFAGFTHEPAILLAERLLPLLPGAFSRIFYSDNGSTSTEVAIKMALQYWWNRGKSEVMSREAEVGRLEPTAGVSHRNKILAFNNSYHGDTFGAMSISDRSVFTMAFHDKLFEVVFIDAPVSAETLLPFIDWNSIACFIYEPLIQGAGGMKMYHAAGLNLLLQKCKEHDIICIADEVMTGFGRTGKLFASEYCENKPDIICLSKGLTGGTMALGVTACTQKIYDAFVSDDKLKTFFHGHSFTANPLACTAALASLDLLQEKTCGIALNNIIEKNRGFLQQLQNSHHKISTRNHRMLGTILAFEMDIGKDEYLNTISTTVTTQALENGVYIRPLGNTVYIMPPYCISPAQLEKVFSIITEILNGA
jgi:adenosylmethionine-8-amino-7-oxononanoate aminotransferase